LTNSNGAITGMSNFSRRASTFTPALSWPCSHGTARLGGGQIHVWSVVLSDFDSDLPQFQAMLSSVERMKAERFRFSKDRNHYVIRRGILRVVLGRYLEHRPSEIDFCYGPFGKPEIKGDLAGGGLNFNDSHSGDLAVYAVTRACPLGVDVEKLRPVPDFEEIASRFFTPREAETLIGLPSERQMEAFFACWTRKEAFLKATGEGIGEGLAKVEVTLTPGEEAEILRIAGESQAQTEWQLRSFSPVPGYLAAVAFRHHNLVLSRGESTVSWIKEHDSEVAPLYGL